MNIQILEKGGMPEYAVIPYADFEKLQESAEMIKDIDSYQKAIHRMKTGTADFIPSDMVERLCEGSNPLKEWRKYRCLTQLELGKKVGVTQAAIASFEKNKREPSVKLLRKIADELDVDLDDLV